MRSFLRSTFILILISALAGAGVWYAMHHWPRDAAGSAERKVLYYQSAMHPWVKSDKPGRCTICGMELTPVYEGDKGFDAKGDVISLSQSQVQVLNVQTSEAKVQPLNHRLSVAGMIDDDRRCARLEVTVFVENVVGRQQAFACDRPDLAAIAERGGVVERPPAASGIHLDRADERRHGADRRGDFVQ